MSSFSGSRHMSAIEPTGTERAIEEAGAKLRDGARRARWRYRRYLAGQYDRDRFFRSVTPDIVGFEVCRLAAKRPALAGSPDYTASLIVALRRRLRRCLGAARRLPLVPPTALSTIETLRVVILGEIAALRRQRATRDAVKHAQEPSAKPFAE